MFSQTITRYLPSDENAIVDLKALGCSEKPDTAKVGDILNTQPPGDFFSYVAGTLLFPLFLVLFLPLVAASAVYCHRSILVRERALPALRDETLPSTMDR